MKTNFKDNWAVIATNAAKIKKDRPEDASLYEYLSRVLMKERMLSRTVAEDTILKLDKGVILYHSQDASSNDDFIQVCFENLSDDLTQEDERELLLNMLLIDRLRCLTIAETENLTEYCNSLRASISADYGTSDSEIARLKKDVSDRLSFIVGHDLQVADAVSTITNLLDYDGAMEEATALLNDKEDALVYAVASYIYFCSHPEKLGEGVEVDDINPETIGLGAATTLAASEAIRQYRAGIFSKKTLQKILKVIYSIFLAGLIALCAWFLICGVAAITIAGVIMSFTLGSFWGVLSLIIAAYFITFSIECIGAISQDLWEWGDNAYEKICGFFSKCVSQVKSYVDSSNNENVHNFATAFDVGQRPGTYVDVL